MVTCDSLKNKPHLWGCSKSELHETYPMCSLILGSFSDLKGIIIGLQMFQTEKLHHLSGGRYLPRIRSGVLGQNENVSVYLINVIRP